jgi:predicted DNA-binding ribbon-helix-helix protein
MRLEAELWDALNEIAARENMTVNEVCTRVRRAHQGTGLTSAVRILLISYFRAKAGSAMAASFDELLGQTFPPRSR